MIPGSSCAISACQSKGAFLGCLKSSFQCLAAGHPGTILTLKHHWKCPIAATLQLVPGAMVPPYQLWRRDFRSQQRQVKLYGQHQGHDSHMRRTGRLSLDLYWVTFQEFWTIDSVLTPV